MRHVAAAKPTALRNPDAAEEVVFAARGAQRIPIAAVVCVREANASVARGGGAAIVKAVDGARWVAEAQVVT